MTNQNGRLALAAALLVWAISPAAPKAATVAVSITGERRMPFNDQWRFFKGEMDGAERPEFDDTKWPTVRLPHDWAIEGPFEPQFGANTGGLPVFGTGWYRKSFTLPEAAKNRYFAIQFDGAMSNSRVWINGHDLGGRPYGYSRFSIDLTPFLQFGDHPNVIAVRLTPEERPSRWYPGAGIYRNVWLDVTGPVQVAPWGTYVTTPEVRTERSTVAVRTELRNRLSRDARITLRTTILDAAGKQVARQNDELLVPASSVQTADTKLTVTGAQL
jgi:beta-galactosidase